MFDHVIILNGFSNLKGFFNFSLNKRQLQQRWNLVATYTFFRSVSFFCSFLTWLYCHCTDIQAGWNCGSIVMNSRILHKISPFYIKFSNSKIWGQEEDNLEGKRDVPFKRLLQGLLENYVPQTLNNKGKCWSLLLIFLPKINYCANYVCQYDVLREWKG